jgi:hypothetical protein
VLRTGKPLSENVKNKNSVHSEALLEEIIMEMLDNSHLLIKSEASRDSAT